MKLLDFTKLMVHLLAAQAVTSTFTVVVKKNTSNNFLQYTLETMLL